MEEVEKSNGGEYHRYAMRVGVPPEMAGHFQMSFDDETFEIMNDPDYGVVLKDPGQDGVPFAPGFVMHAEEGGAPVEDPTEHDKRMAELEHAGFAKGFAWGLGYGGYDMVKSTGETIVGVAKFAGRGVMQVGLRFTWAMNWITGQDDTVVNEWITQEGVRGR